MRKTSFTLAGPMLVLCFPAGCSRGPQTLAEKGPIPPGSYAILEGDDLSTIALRADGDRDLWDPLLHANAHPPLAQRPQFKLEIGESITIPDRDHLDRSLPKSVFPKSLPADYIVMPGDSLPFIAQGCYGDRDQWMRIYEANRHILSERVKENPRQLIAGRVLH